MKKIMKINQANQVALAAGCFVTGVVNAVANLGENQTVVMGVVVVAAMGAAVIAKISSSTTSWSMQEG